MYDYDVATDISSRAMLARVSIRVWQAGTVDEEVTNDTNARYGVSRERGHYWKRLMNADEYSRVTAATVSARKVFRSQTLMWSEGLRILPAENFDPFTKKVNEARNVWQDAVDDFCRAYPRLVQRALLDVSNSQGPSMAKRSDYPDDGEIDRYFQFTSAFYPVPTAGDFRVELASVHAERIKQDIEDELLRQQREWVREPLLRLQEVVKHLADSLEGNGRVFEANFDAVREMCDLAERLNVGDDQDIVDWVEEVRRDVLEQFRPSSVRGNPFEKGAAAETAREIADRMARFV